MLSFKLHLHILNGKFHLTSPLCIPSSYDQTLRYSPIQKFGPSDCIASINAIIANFDTLVDSNNTEAIQDFKILFGLGDLVDSRDFAMTIAFPSNYVFFLFPKRSSNIV